MALIDGYYYRRIRRSENDASRFLTFSCFHRLQLFANHRIKDAFVEHLLSVAERERVRLHEWVVMPEHVHLLLTRGEGVTVRRFVSVLKGPFARRVVGRWLELKAGVLERVWDGEKYRFWQPGGGHDRNIWTPSEFLEKRDYIRKNPIRRGLCQDLLGWRWSSAYLRLTARPEDGPVAPEVGAINP